MLKFKEIALKEFYPGVGRGMRAGYTCAVTLQHGECSYDTIKVELPVAAVHSLVAFAVGKAMEHLTFDAASIDVLGSAGEPYPDEPSPQPSDLASEPMVITAAQEAF